MAVSCHSFQSRDSRRFVTKNKSPHRKDSVLANMDPVALISVLWILLRFLTPTLQEQQGGDCPKKCFCYLRDNAWTVACERQRMPQIPADIFPGTHVLQFASNWVEELDKKTFQVNVCSLLIFIISHT